jgi:hypothetical protein
MVGWIGGKIGTFGGVEVDFNSGVATRVEDLGAQVGYHRLWESAARGHTWRACIFWMDMVMVRGKQGFDRGEGCGTK